MLKIVKPGVYNFDKAKPVQLVVEEPKPAPQPEEEHVLTPEEEEKLRIQEEERQRLEEERLLEEKIARRVSEALEARETELTAHRDKILEAGRAEAERLISEARVKTASVMDACEKECTMLRAKAEHDGYEEGLSKGRAEAVEKCEKYLEAAATLLSEINSRKETYYISNEYEMRETVMELVRKITMAELSADKGVIDRIIANAAKNFRNSDFLKISLCEGEASKELVTDAEFVKSLIPFIPDIEIEELSPEDAPSGTIVLDNGSEIIDASIPTQLDFIKEIMRSSMSSDDDGTVTD